MRASLVALNAAALGVFALAAVLIFRSSLPDHGPDPWLETSFYAALGSGGGLLFLAAVILSGPRRRGSTALAVLLVMCGFLALAAAFGALGFATFVRP